MSGDSPIVVTKEVGCPSTSAASGHRSRRPHGSNFVQVESVFVEYTLVNAESRSDISVRSTLGTLASAECRTHPALLPSR